MKSKTCTKCNKPRKVDEFNFKNRATGRRHTVCKFCHKEYRTSHYNANKAKYVAKANRWNKAHPEYSRQRKYGVSQEEYDRQLEAQGGLCKICRKKDDKPLGTDHDHRTGRFRGLLCGKCNRGIGHFDDRPDLLIAAAKYLGD